MQQPSESASGSKRVVEVPDSAITNSDPLAERRLWLAVVMQAVVDWRGGTLKSRRLAQQFLFGQGDFEIVCANAGLDASDLRSRLLKIGRKVNTEGPWARHPLAA